jgi:glycosyltransferase involved in cell wall biosynthesis
VKSSNLVGKNFMEKPFFSIGITTYNRPQLLKRCLQSLLRQSFTDFEVIIGNDYIAQELNLEDIGITDPRFKIINHKKNLGERQNLNFLLTQANGKYFTWQFDDDYYSDFFLEKVYALLTTDNSLNAVFTSYEKVFNHELVVSQPAGENDLHSLSGKKFVKDYLKGNIKAMGLTGVYDTDFLRSIGGAKQLTTGPYALYSEYLLLLHSAGLERVGYVSSPMVYYYVHNLSWGNSNSELALYKHACENLYVEGANVLKGFYQGKELRTTLFGLFKLVIHDYYKKSFTLPFIKALKDTGYATHLLRLYAEYTGGSRVFNMLKLKIHSVYLMVFPFVKTKLKMSLPESLLIPLQRFHSKFQ